MFVSVFVARHIVLLEVKISENNLCMTSPEKLISNTEGMCCHLIKKCQIKRCAYNIVRTRMVGESTK